MPHHLEMDVALRPCHPVYSDHPLSLDAPFVDGWTPSLVAMSRVGTLTGRQSDPYPLGWTQLELTATFPRGPVT